MGRDSNSSPSTKTSENLIFLIFNFFNVGPIKDLLLFFKVHVCYIGRCIGNVSLVEGDHFVDKWPHLSQDSIPGPLPRCIV